MCFTAISVSALLSMAFAQGSTLLDCLPYELSWICPQAAGHRLNIVVRERRCLAPSPPVWTKQQSLTYSYIHSRRCPSSSLTKLWSTSRRGSRRAPLWSMAASASVRAPQPFNYLSITRMLRHYPQVLPFIIVYLGDCVMMTSRWCMAQPASLSHYALSDDLLMMAAQA